MTRYRTKLPLWLLLCLSLLSINVHAGDTGISDYWTNVYPLPGKSTFYALHWDGSKFIAPGKFGAIITSTNGSDWSSVNSRTSVDLTAVTKVGASYYVIGWGGTLLKSIDGIDWTAATIGKAFTAAGRSVKYRAITDNGSGTIIAVGDSGEMARYSDGSWTTGAIRIPFNDTIKVALLDVIWHNNLFYAVGSQGAIISSPDGKPGNWIKRNNIIDQNAFSVKLNKIIWDDSNSQFIIIGDEETILTSADGSNWHLMYSAVINDVPAIDSNVNCDITSTKDRIEKCRLHAIAVGAGTLVIVSHKGLILNSTDGGDTWTTVNSNISSTLHAVAWNGSLFVAIGSNAILTSPDGMTWTSQSSSAPGLKDIASNGSNQFVAINDTGTVLNSNDGFAWNTLTTSALSGLSNISWDADNSRYIAVVNKKEVARSTTGEHWTTIGNISTNADITDITAGNQRYVAVSDSGIIWESTDLASWNKAYPTIGPATGPLYTVIWDGDRFLALGPASGDQIRMLTSSDGTSWQTQTSGTHILHFEWSSGDGSSRIFTPGSWPDSSAYQLAWNGRQYVLVGDVFVDQQGNKRGGTVYYSYDGLTWYFPPSIGGAGNLSGVAWNGSHFVVNDNKGNLYINTGPDLGLIGYLADGTVWSPLLNAYTGTVHEPMTYTFNITSNGDLDAAAITLTITIAPELQSAPTITFNTVPDGVLCDDLTPPEIVCTITQIKAGGADDKEITIVITPVDKGAILVVATLTLASDNDVNLSSNQTRIYFPVQSTTDKINNDFNASKSGIGFISQWLLLLLFITLFTRLRRHRFSPHS